jgi:ribose transport system permease protein
MGVSVLLVAYFQSTSHLSPAEAILLTLLCGLGVGAVNGFVVVRLRVDSFIATLAMTSILEAAMQWISGGQEIVTGIPTSFTNLGGNQFLGLTLPFYYMLVVAIVLWYVMSYRETGRYLYATGSNPDAARLAGVNTARLRVLALLASAGISSLAGIIFMAKIGSASLDTGTPYLLPAFAAVFLGATQFRARHPNVLGTVIAVYALATGIKGLQLAGAAPWVNYLFNGLALIVAVALAVRSSRKTA